MIDLHTIQERHHRLYDAFIRNASEVKSDQYRNELKTLLNDIKEFSPRVSFVQDYSKLRAAVDQWRKAGPALGIKMAELDDIVLIAPSPDEISGSASDLPMWPDHSLARWVQDRASEFSKYRAIAWRESITKHSIDQIVELHRKSIPPEEAARWEREDYLQAQVYLASDVLDGKFDLVRSMGPDSYHRLEGEDGRMWLRHVKALRAYWNWEARGGDTDTDATQAPQADYLKACQELRDPLLAPQRKAPQSAFEPIQRYLQEEFLATDNRLDCTKDRTKLWIDVKSQQLLETQGAPERALARTAAEDQMRKFYENITRAVLAVDEKSTRLVLKALGLCPGFEHYEAIVNCLEMAVAIYFLDPETAKKALSENQQTDSVPSA